MHISNLYKVLFFLAVFLIITECTPYYYAPNMHNVPLFQGKNEFRLDFSGSTGQEYSGYEVQTAIAPTDNFGIMLNGFKVKKEDNYDNRWGKGYLIEGAIGTFLPVDKHSIFEFYGGMGYGSVENGYNDQSSSILNFNRFFIQPSIGFTSNYFDMAISSKLCGLKYNNIKLHGNIESDDLENITYINQHPFSILFEPAFTLRCGWKYLKIQFQMGFSKNLSNPELKQEKLNMNLGLYLNFKSGK